MSYTAPQINLLTKRKKAFNKQSAFAVRAKVWSGTVLVVYSIVLVLLVAFNVFFLEKATSTQEALDQANMSLSSSAVIVKQYEAVVSRSKTIEILLSERRESIKLWQQLRQILPEGTELTTFELEGSALNISVSAPNVLFANQVVDMIEKSIPTIGVHKTIVDVSRESDASYKVGMVLSLESLGKNKKS
jgi:Tfp pilus assembly protein PilN